MPRSGILICNSVRISVYLISCIYFFYGHYLFDVKMKLKSVKVPFICVFFRDKLAPVKLNRYKDDLLFYMFYTNVGDVLQLAAAAEL